jgi:serine/threonine protein kinase
MLFEYISGGELFSRLRKEGRFANDVGLFYACEILLSLQYLHQRHIVYRDLKPENLLIDKEGHIKITDFGFAKKVITLIIRKRSSQIEPTLCAVPPSIWRRKLSRAQKPDTGKVWTGGLLVF